MKSVKDRLIVSLCDFTGNWSRPYEEAGYPVIRVDLKQGQDARLFKLPKQKVWGILAAPPCTVFAASGSRWVRTDAEMLEGLSVVDACLRIVYACKPKWWALENPVGKLATDYLGKPDFYFDPCDYGDPYTKKTCLWGDFNPPIACPVEPVEGSKMHTLPGGGSEKKREIRSATPLGFAKAFYEANK